MQQYSNSRYSQNNKFLLNAHLIAEDLNSLTNSKIKDYPITDLSDSDLESILKILSSSTLAKVMLNIPKESLEEIEERITREKFENIINKLPENDYIQIVERFDRLF